MPDVAGFDYALIAALLLAAAVAGYAWWRASGPGRLRRRAAIQARLENTEAILRAGPDALFVWAHGDGPQLFGGASLGLRASDAFDGFCAGLDGASRANLLAALAQLRATGQRFAFPLLGKDARTFAATGKPAGHGVALWISDVTAAFEEIHGLRDALGESLAEHRMLRDAVDLSPFPVWRRDDAGQIIWANRAYCKALGAPSLEAVMARGEHLVDQGALAQAEQHGAALRMRTVINGARRVLDVYDTPEATGGYGLALDLTGLEEAQRALRRQIDAQAATINLLHTPMLIYSASKQVEFFNQAFANLWGLAPAWLASGPQHSEVLEAMRASGLLPEQADFPAWKRKQLSLYNELIDSQEELWHLPDARTLRVVIQPRPQGGLLMVYEDLTAMLTLERSFNALTRVQSESLNGLQEGVAVFGADGRLSLFNPALLQHWELDAAYLERRPHIDQMAILVQPYMLNPEVYDGIKQYVTCGEVGRVMRSARVERDDGAVLDCTAVPLPDGGTMLTFDDVSDSVRIERALRERNEALLTADRLKSEFISHISYHLRTPLNSIIGFVEMLEQEFFGPLNPRQHEYTQGSLEASHQLLTLVNDIIDLATIEAGDVDLVRAPVDVLGLLTVVCDLSRTRARQANIELRLDCAQQHSDIDADSRRIKQVMFNLLSNAFHFSNAGDTVTIGASRVTGAGGEDICQLWVRDQGAGIDQDFQENMFDAFKSHPRKGKSQGAGIGLSLVRRLIELHGGWIEVESAPGYGAKVTCNLPQTTAARAPQPSTTPVV